MPRLNPVTGVGITTRVAMESADLGIMRYDPQRGAIAAVWGDNFEFWRMQGEWQSPSITMHDNDLRLLGVPTKEGIDPNGRRRQCWDYPHNNPDYSTILPCDLVRVGDWWYLAAMVTAGLGHEKRTIFWRSRDLVDWEKTDPYIRLDHLDAGMRPVGHPGNTMLTFDTHGEHVYIFGTGGLARNKPIWLWRSPIDLFPYGEWEPMNHGNPILGGRYGELCFRVQQGNCVLSFFDAGEYRQTALTVVNPTDDWSRAHRVDYAHGQHFPQLYGGYIVPGSKLNEQNGMKFLVSQWNTANNDPYHVVRFEDTLQAMGPLKTDVPQPPIQPVRPKPPRPTGPRPIIPPNEVENMTPQELYNLLLKELSASASEPIVTPEGEKLTLRQAVEQVFWKERGPHDLSNGRPRHPVEEDDQLGHVLNTRAEGLQTLTVVVAIADSLGIDVARLFAQVQESLG